MKYLILILSFISTVAHAQLDPIYSDKTFFNTDLTANKNHTHNGAKKVTTIRNLGGWIMSAGVANPMSVQLDSTTFLVEGAGLVMLRGQNGLYLRGGVGLNPKINLVSNKIEFDATSGLYYFRNLPVYANDAAAASGGLLQDAIYKTSSGVLMVKL